MSAGKLRICATLCFTRSTASCTSASGSISTCTKLDVSRVTLHTDFTSGMVFSCCSSGVVTSFSTSSAAAPRQLIWAFT